MASTAILIIQQSDILDIMQGYEALVELEENGVKVTFRLPKKLMRQLKVYAGMHGMTVTSVVIKACDEFMDRDKVFKERFRPHIA
jgi:hypothetical protein